VALLGIAQHLSRVPRAHIPAAWYRRKPLPTSIKTLGDLIHVKRNEKRLSLGRVAIKMGIAAADIRVWEANLSQPDVRQMELLAKILDFQPANDKLPQRWLES